MSVTATELKKNLGKYLVMAATEDVIITKNGKVIAKLVSTEKDRIEGMESLFGCIPADATLEDAREEHLKEI